MIRCCCGLGCNFCGVCFKTWDWRAKCIHSFLAPRGGDTDTFWPGAACKAQRHLPRAVIRTIDGAGHLAPMERPREVGEVIESFLEKVAASETQHRNIPVG